MEAGELREKIEEAGGEKAETSHKRLAVYISVLAAALAIADLGGSNAGSDAVNANIQSSDNYSYYQEKRLRQIQYEMAARSLELSMLSRPDLTPDQRTEAREQIASYKATAAGYESQPQTDDGKKELLAKAQRFADERERSETRDGYFDTAETLLQLAVVLASVSTVVGVAALVWLSGACSAAGLLSLVNGFTLLVDIPLF